MLGSLEKEFGVTPRKSVTEDAKSKKSSISPFEFVNQISYGKEELIVDEWSERQYNPYLINMALSFGADTILYANMMNECHHLDHKLQNDFLLAIVRKKKRFNKWEKREKQGKKIQIIKQYYGYSNAKAEQVARLITEDAVQKMERYLFAGGTQ